MKLTNEEKCTYCREYGNLPCDECNEKLEAKKAMSKTKYRKVKIEIDIKDHDEVWLIGKSANFIFNPNTRNGEELFDFLSCCEEIPENSQIEKLEAEKKELLEALEKIIVIQDKYFGEQQIHSRLRAFCVQIESLIQKHQ